MLRSEQLDFFRPIDDNGSLDPDLLAYAKIFGTPEDALTGDLRKFLAYAIARYIGTTPRGERTNIRDKVKEPVGEAAEEALRIERRFRLHDEILPAPNNRDADDLLLLMGTAKPARLRWAHTVTNMLALRTFVLAARDRFLADSQPQDSQANIVDAIPHALPVDPGWQAPSIGDVMIGTEAHLARWVTRQSPAPEGLGPTLYIDAKAADPSKRASTDDGFETYVNMLVDEESNKTAAEIEDVYTIAVVSSNPHWIFQALAAKRHISAAVANGRLRGNYRIVVLAYPLEWGLKSHIYVLGGLVRAVLQWAMLNQPDAVPSTEEIMAWAEQIKTERQTAAV